MARAGQEYFGLMSWLLFFPSITFGLLVAEVFPWSIIIFLLFSRRIEKQLVGILALMLTSAVAGIYLSGDFLQPLRSLAAFSNALLALSLVLTIPGGVVDHLLRTARTILFFLLCLGILQYFMLLEFLEPGLQFLVPRSSAGLLAEMGRGVTLLSSEPARAGVEVVFLYSIFRCSFDRSSIWKYGSDTVIGLFILLVIQSAAASAVYGVYLLFLYGRRSFFPLLLLGVLFSPVFLAQREGNRTIDLIVSLMQMSSWSDIFFELVDTSGHRLISIFSSYSYGITHPIGAGIGNWVSGSLWALEGTGLRLEEYRYFQVHGFGAAVPIRASGFLSNLVLEAGVVGVAIVLHYFKRSFSGVSKMPPGVRAVVCTFMVSTFFVGSVGATVPFVCVGLAIRLGRRASGGAGGTGGL